MEVYLSQAERLLSDVNPDSKLWIEKWRVIADSLQQGRDSGRVTEVLNSARAIGHWETVRDCSFYLAQLGRNHKLMNQVYFGTPYSSYRESVLRKVSDWYHPAATYLHHTHQKFKSVLNLRTGRLDEERELVTYGQVHHRLLRILTQDLFRPVRLVSAFSQLFPEEYFNPHSSPMRIHQAVTRLRKILADANLDVEVVVSDGDYRLVLGPRLALKLDVISNNVDPKYQQIEMLLENLPKEFTMRQASAVLSASSSASLRLLRWAVENHKLMMVGAGPKTRYRTAA